MPQQFYVIRQGASEDELMHYGVPGMKWGVRRAQKLVNKASSARRSAATWEERAKQAAAKGRMNKAAKFKENAAKDKATAAKFQQRADRKVERRIKKAGKQAGRAEYYTDKANAAYQQHEKNAAVFDKAAKNLEKNGSTFRAEAARRTAEAIRKRGENVRATEMQNAEYFIKKSTKLNQKAKDFAKSANINLGKKRVDSIFNSAKTKSYEQTKNADEYYQDKDREERIGKPANDLYKKVTGRG